MIRNKVLTLIAVISTLFAKSQPTLQLQLIASGIPDPTAIAHAGDNRLFVCEQIGRIRIINNGVLSPTPFLNIQSRVISGGEQGLLGLAFSPNYATDRSFYVHYTDTNGIGNTVVSRFKVSTTNPDSALPSSEQILFTTVQPYTNHNGGCLQFGPDGYLYIGLGDGGDGGDPQNFAQNRLSFLGKFLRIDVSNTQFSSYTIPPSNPFVGLSSTLNEIWSIGWRNPWRFSFDKYTGEMWVGDVGQGSWEEIDREATGNGGLNYGWRCREGAHNYNPSGCTNTYTDPVFEYSHAGGSCSVTGGYVYRGSNYSGLSGYYFFADYCNQNIYALDYNSYTNTIARPGSGNITTFGEDLYGELYIGKSNGTIYRLTDTTSCVPNAIVLNTTGTFYCGDSVQLATPFNPAFTYQWFFNGAPLLNAAGSTYWAKVSGNYSVYVEKNIACFDTSDVFVLGPCGFVNVPSLDEKITADVIPNPSNGIFFLNLKNISAGIYKYRLIETSGKVLINDSFGCEDRDCELRVQLSTKGVYFIEVTNNTGVVVREKIVAM